MVRVILQIATLLGAYWYLFEGATLAKTAFTQAQLTSMIEILLGFLFLFQGWLGFSKKI